MEVLVDATYRAEDIEPLPLAVGFLAAFISGCLACKLMLDIVKRGKLIYFGIYCAILGVFTILVCMD